MAEPDLTSFELKTLLHYDEVSGIFYGLKTQSKRLAGMPAGTIEKHGYTKISIKCKRYYAHRLAWLYVTGNWPSGALDHINGERSDNRISNLRLATSSENNQNLKGPKKNNKSGLLGVSFDKERNLYVTMITIEGRGKFIGRFKTAEEAHAAYINKKREVHPGCTL